MSIKFYHWIPNDIVVISDVVFCLQAPLQARKARLENAERLKKYNHDVEDEEAWIREKEPIVSSTNTGTGCVWILSPDCFTENEVLQKVQDHFCFADLLPCCGTPTSWCL